MNQVKIYKKAAFKQPFLYLLFNTKHIKLKKLPLAQITILYVVKQHSGYHW